MIMFGCFRGLSMSYLNPQTSYPASSSHMIFLLLSPEYEVVSTTKGPNGDEVSILITNQTHTAVENLSPNSRYVSQTLVR